MIRNFRSNKLSAKNWLKSAAVTGHFGLGVATTMAQFGCEGVVVVDRPYRRRPPPAVVYFQPAPVVVQPAPQPVMVPPPVPSSVGEPPPQVVVPAPAPVVYEEGVVVNGVLLAEPVGVTDYVFIGGGWYYWYPTLGIWVHAHRPSDWRPREGVHVYRNWSDHPMYRRPR